MVESSLRLPRLPSARASLGAVSARRAQPLHESMRAHAVAAAAAGRRATLTDGPRLSARGWIKCARVDVRRAESMRIKNGVTLGSLVFFMLVTCARGAGREARCGGHRESGMRDARAVDAAERLSCEGGEDCAV
ncbi:hypothetical protein SRHO_G00316240 [Serrasalmus rhombeus]